MSNKKSSRNTKTNEKIKEEIKLLLEKKPLKNINVSEICRNININRGTFYLHFRDIEDLIETLKQEIASGFISEIQEHYKGGTHMLELFRAIFDFYCRNGHLVNILFQNDFSIINQKVFSIIKESWTKSDNMLSNEVLESIYAFIASGSIAYINKATETGSYSEESFQTYMELVENSIFNTIYNIE